MLRSRSSKSVGQDQIFIEMALASIDFQLPVFSHRFSLLDWLDKVNFSSCLRVKFDDFVKSWFMPLRGSL